VYTIAFGVILQARWGFGGGTSEYALMVFAGLIVFNAFAECLNNAPSLISSNPNYVKKVVFPLEVLPWVTALAAILHAVIGIAVWLAGLRDPHRRAEPAALLFPLVCSRSSRAARHGLAAFGARRRGARHRPAHRRSSRTRCSSSRRSSTASKPRRRCCRTCSLPIRSPSWSSSCASSSIRPGAEPARARGVLRPRVRIRAAGAVVFRRLRPRFADLV
jgi:hypothetical protein